MNSLTHSPTRDDAAIPLSPPRETVRRGLTGFAWREALVLCLLLTLGFGLRAWKLSVTEIDHYDEGVYAFSGLGFADHTQPYVFYSDQIKFSPPVFPLLVSLAFRIGGPAGFSGNMLNAVLGTLTILVLWWVARLWFGAAAAAATAAMLTCSTYHVAFSRALLTDVAFALIFLIAVSIAEVAFRRNSLPVAVGAGLLTGLAWNTKYHGWFVLVIFAGVIISFAWRRLLSLSFGPQTRRLCLLWIVMAGTAVLCYLPWLWFIQSQPGGYAALAKYQRTLLSLHYFTNLWSQARQQFFWESPFSRFSIPLAIVCAAFVDRRRVLSKQSALLVTIVTAVGLLAGSSAAVLLMAILAAPSLYIAADSWRGRILVAWLALWVVSTPVYHPYSRLLLPFTIASFLAAGYWISRQLQKPQSVRAIAGGRTILACGLLIVLLGIFSFRLPGADLWQPTRDFADSAAQMATLIPPGSRVFAIGEPGVAFYVHLTGRPAFERRETYASLAHLKQPAYVITGLYAKVAPELVLMLRKLGPRLERLSSFPATPGRVRLLDDFPAGDDWHATGHLGNPYDLTLYLLRPE